MSFERSNDYLMEIEFCLNQSNELNSQMLLFLNVIEKKYLNSGRCLDITSDVKSFRVSCKGIVDSDNNTIINTFFAAIKDFKTAFVDSVNKGGNVDFSIYLWLLKASDTPQIDFNLERVQLLGEIGANLSFVVYTYDPE
ncbi:hypothetical protein [Acinetobacter rudis]|uniref:DUF4279 domain-containing protein n=1 Tax=Acinetobacter rudis TaxID=632955 RepID=A0AAW8JCU0_9GAMM|nr:hypothetical protein [Acinetobacter rudis]MDQ8936415.1 hypothetical protein [Acinetobacter rudis]MDQ9018634.1 hypothetical protein [Acinetobacter rudis]